jgi:hypothetical protein
MKSGDQTADPTAIIPDIVKRAGIILARQTPVGALASQLLDAGAESVAEQALTLPGVASVEELRGRAMDLVGELFSSFGNGGLGRNAGGLPFLSPGAGGPARARPGASSGSYAPAADNFLNGLFAARSSAPIAAGRATTLSLQVENRENKPVQASFYSTDLLDEMGHEIPAHQVSFEPPTLTLRPGERATVNAKIDVPLQSVPGAYSGLVQAAGLPTSKAVITIDVM